MRARMPVFAVCSLLWACGGSLEPALFAVVPAAAAGVLQLYARRARSN